jgi:hypothetical protein
LQKGKRTFSFSCNVPLSSAYTSTCNICLGGTLNLVDKLLIKLK